MYESLVIFGATNLLWAIVIGAISFFVYSPRKKDIVLLAIVALPLTILVGKLAGMLWYDPLPFVVGNFAPLIEHVANNGFPSDHVLVSAALGSILFVFDRYFGAFLVVLAVVMGLCRVLAGVHHSIDVVAAALIAVGCTALASCAIQYARRYTSRA